MQHIRGTFSSFLFYSSTLQSCSTRKIEPFTLEKFTGISVAEPNLRKYVNGYLVIKIDGHDISRTIDIIKERFDEFDPEHPFEFAFLDASLNKIYQSEDRLMKMIGISAAVCIFISCMGLFGLVAFITVILQSWKTAQTNPVDTLRNN